MQFKPNEHERHEYSANIVWTGARAGPTTSYQAYSREYEFRAGDKPAIRGSADPYFRGDPRAYNPEDLVVVALSACHLLSYLADCARAGVHVVAYEDNPHGVMSFKDGKLRFTEVTLRPRVTVAAGTDMDRARALHEKAHDGCYVASSVNFPVRHEATIVIAEED